MAMSIPYPVQLDFQADRHISRWRPLVQWLLAIPHLLIANVLRTLRQVLTLISLVTVLFTERIPRPLFDMIAMTYRYEWRAFSYAMFLHDDYPPFDFQPAADDDGVEGHTPRSASPTPSTSTGGSPYTNGSWPSRTTWSSPPCSSPACSHS